MLKRLFHYKRVCPDMAQFCPDISIRIRDRTLTCGPDINTGVPWCNVVVTWYWTDIRSCANLYQGNGPDSGDIRAIWKHIRAHQDCRNQGQVHIRAGPGPCQGQETSGPRGIRASRFRRGGGQIGIHSCLPIFVYIQVPAMGASQIQVGHGTTHSCLPFLP